jgi:hypothetical protein
MSSDRGFVRESSTSTTGSGASEKTAAPPKPARDAQTFHVKHTFVAKEPGQLTLIAVSLVGEQIVAHAFRERL